MAPHRAGLDETGGVVGSGGIVVDTGDDVVGGRVGNGVGWIGEVVGNCGAVLDGPPGVVLLVVDGVPGEVVTVEDGAPGEVVTGDDGAPGEVVTVVAGAEVVGGVGLPPPLSASAGTAMPTAPRATAPATITIRLRTCDSSRSVAPLSGTLTRIHAVGR
ncbi:hypothetical protein ABZ345_46775 [Lentzea sp. NPDC005914]|uniref:hypothetical protein n=1 Tax=Lentzea sp. NPDC005914 TaxID=3154572 RepID=UPI0033DE11BB